MYFFNILGDYAKLKNTVIALEANPDIYGTNFINTTKEAFSFVKKLLFIYEKRRIFIVRLLSIQQSAVEMHLAGHFLESGATQNGSYWNSDD